MRYHIFVMGNSRSSDNLVIKDLPTRTVFVQFDRYITQEAERYNSKHERYIFTIKYLRYYWQISRRFNDIVTLDNRLNRPYRHQQIMANILRPPKFNKLFWSHNEALLLRRGRCMAAYLQSIVDIPELFEEKIVRIFLEVGKVFNFACRLLRLLTFHRRHSILSLDVKAKLVILKR